jgi:hypothetical protein
MPKNQVNNKDADSKVQETKMIPLTVEITEPFYKFLKEYLAFFGSHMTIEDIAQQMIYQESQHLHNDLTEYIKDVDNNHYVGTLPWFKKYREVAVTTGNWDIFNEALPPEEKQDNPEAPATEETPAADIQPKQ